ncbi:hypothetical protein CDAR_315991 [Caerostris darwini]|uniref:Uncharacterized protein n=1 Tax=Caerostris darwini TaxID=1538125 RepID=A0AAV4MAY6_9ARAC|nr:hypothetical protein CDAR_315991 [Caerostris darwini]
MKREISFLSPSLKEIVATTWQAKKNGVTYFSVSVDLQFPKGRYSPGSTTDMLLRKISPKVLQIWLPIESGQTPSSSSTRICLPFIPPSSVYLWILSPQAAIPSILHQSHLFDHRSSATPPTALFYYRLEFPTLPLTIQPVTPRGLKQDPISCCFRSLSTPSTHTNDLFS